jgi:MFS family permease/quinol monooxygenase YgiN
VTQPSQASVPEGVAAGGTLLPSPWAPLRSRLFLGIWLTQVISNVGSLMQNAGGAWLMTSLGGSAFLVASMQTAAAVPVVLIGVPAGALADIVDRRRLMIGAQTWMAVNAAILALLTYLHHTTPALLLGLTFAMSLGLAASGPASQGIQPEIVPRHHLPQAIGLTSMSYNVGRAVGPALAGLVIVVGGPQLVFLLNAVSFFGVIGVLVAWRRAPTVSTAPRETLVGAMRAGLRYSLHSLAFRAVMIRTALYIVPGSALLALLPVAARRLLHLGAGGFGLLLAAFGAGAVAAAILLPRFRAKASADALLAASATVVAATLVVVAYVHQPVVVGIVLVAGGGGWMLGSSSLTVSAQSSVPDWVRSRGMGLLQLVIWGGVATGSLIFGALAGVAGLSVSLAAAAALLAVNPLARARWPLRISERLDLTPSPYWPEPVVVLDPAPGHGPVLVTVSYTVPTERADEFAQQMRRVERQRRRTGARRWALWRDTADPQRFVETFVVESWEEHLRQHHRVTATDQQMMTEIARIYSAQPEVTHLLSAY